MFHHYRSAAGHDITQFAEHLVIHPRILRSGRTHIAGLPACNNRNTACPRGAAIGRELLARGSSLLSRSGSSPSRQSAVSTRQFVFTDYSIMLARLCSLGVVT